MPFSDIFAVVLPLFGLALAGYVAGRAGWVEEAGIKGISAFVFYLAIPALLFRTLVRSELPTTFDLDIVFAYFTASLAVMLAARAIGRFVFANRADELAVMGIGAMYSNAVLLGIPLVFAVFGEAGLLPMMMIVTFHSLILLPLVMVLIEVARGGAASAGGSRRVLVSTLAAVFRNPVILAMLAGIAYKLTGLGLPRPVDAFAELLSGATAPCALFALGATLAAYRLGGDLRECAAVVALKLFVHPAAVWLMATQVFVLPPLWAGVAILTAALPSGVNVFIIARQYDVYLARASATVLISTGLSVATLVALIVWIAPPA